MSTIDVTVLGATTSPAGLDALFGDGVSRAVLTTWSVGRDAVLRDLDSWAPLVERFRP